MNKPRHKIIYLLVAFVVALALLPACSMKDAVGKMSMELKQVRVKDFSQSGFTAVVLMQVNNPNGFGVTISDFDYHASVSDMELASGQIEKEIVIPANGSVIAELPLNANLGSLDSGTAAMILRGKLDYRITGEAVFKTWFGSYRYPFSVSGKKLEKKALER